MLEELAEDEGFENGTEAAAILHQCLGRDRRQRG